MSKLFGVTADYLLNDNYESDYDVPAVKNTEISARNTIKKIVALCVSAFGLFGNFVIYILSRFIKVMIPYVTYDKDGNKWYNYGKLTGRSYKYFIREYSLEFLTIIFWILFAAGLIVAFVNRKRIKEVIAKHKEQNDG